MFLHKIKSDLSTFYKPGKLLRLYYWPQHLFFLKLLPCAHFANQSAAASTNSNSLSFGIRELEMNKNWRSVVQNTQLSLLHSQTSLKDRVIVSVCHFLSTDSASECDHLPSEETRRILTSYLSEVTFAEEDEFGLRLPNRNMPDGFQVSHMRCCERSLYGFMPGFTIVLSKEISRDIKTANVRASV